MDYDLNLKLRCMYVQREIRHIHTTLLCSPPHEPGKGMDYNFDLKNLNSETPRHSLTEMYVCMYRGIRLVLHRKHHIHTTTHTVHPMNHRGRIEGCMCVCVLIFIS